MKKLDARMPSFLDELEKISFSVPGAQQVGDWARAVPGQVKDWAKAAPGRATAWAKAAPGRAVTGIKNAPRNIHRGFIGGAQNIGRAAEAFTRPGTSIPEGIRASWHGAHPAFKGLMAYGMLQGAHSVSRAEDPAGLGRSRLHRGLQFAGEQLGGFIGAPYGMAGGLAASLVGSKAGDVAGRAVDFVRGHRARNTPPHLPPAPQGM